MRSAVDSSVLLDSFLATPEFGPRSRETLRGAALEGALIACEVVWAEVRAFFTSKGEFESTMRTLDISFDGSDAECAELAGEAWRRYRSAGGPRTRLIPDFLVAAHALVRADRLLTRDRGFTRRYFPKLKILDPSG
ncbi:MAG: type II toxin-antitoxin system VapC family toxin [Thermoanaerobaculia bacterium]